MRSVTRAPGGAAGRAPPRHPGRVGRPLRPDTLWPLRRIECDQRADGPGRRKASAEPAPSPPWGEAAARAGSSPDPSRFRALQSESDVRTPRKVEHLRGDVLCQLLGPALLVAL